jgi:RNA polymerase sigma-70 factor (ECF subfamily)
MDDARVATTEKLLAEMGWVRQLARALVKDAALAEDVAQDTWLVAAKEQPDFERPIRPWLSRVVKTLVHTRRRSQARRAEHEGAFEDTRSARTPAELVERVELQRAVADEVLALAEPYRSTILLHFVEGHSSAEIARQLGIPDGTVRRRLKVALDQLRDALAKRTDQPRRGWMAALVPFAMSQDSPRPPATIGAIAMKKLIGLVVLLLVLVAIGVGLWRHHSHRAHDGVAGGAADRAKTGGAHDSAGAAMTAVPEWMAQSGAPRRRIAGTVMFQGKPIGGAKVTLGVEGVGEAGPVIITAEEMPLFTVLQRVAEVTSAPDGTFDFGMQPPTQFTVSALAPSYAAGVAFIDNANPRASSEHLLVQLAACGMRLSGVISDASGGGIAKATVSVDSIAGAESDANGNYSVCVAPHDAMGMPSVMVRVEADGYGSMKQTVLAVADLRQDFQLVPEAVLVGRVTTSSGEPVAGARVLAQAEPSEIPRHIGSGWADTDAHGKFRIARLAPGAFLLSARAKGMSMTPMPIFAQATTTSREFHLVLERQQLARVRGHVFKANAPAGGVRIHLVANGITAGGGISQADGSFELDAVPYGKTKLFAAPDQADATAEIDVAKPLVDDVRIDITKAGTIHGHVTRRGKPAPGADVVYMPPPQATFFGGNVGMKTDASGAFSLDLPAGPGQLVVWSNAQKAFSNPVRVDVTSNEDKTMDIELEFAGEVIGTVVNEAGAVVPGVYVRLDLADGSGDMCESVTNAKGQFDCFLLLGGEYRPTVTPSPSARLGFAPASGDHFATIQVPKDDILEGIQIAIKDERFAISGTVLDDTGAPMSDAYVAAVTPGMSTMDLPSTLSDAAGHFTLANLARGTYSLTAHSAEGSDGFTPDVVAGTTTASIKVPRAGAIAGTLTGFTSAPTVFVMSIPGIGPPLPLAGGRAIVEGTKFTRAGLAPGRYTVDAMAGADSDAASVELRPGETLHVDLHSRALGSVEGTVAELATHKPLVGMRCDAKISNDGQTSFFPPDPSFQSFTDAAGHFKVKAPAGQVRIFCFAPTDPMLSPAGTDIDVQAGATAKVSVFSVRGAPGAPPCDPGFGVIPGLPITVAQVMPAGPAAAAGLRAGDQLVTIDGTSLQGMLPEGAMRLVLNHRPGTTVTLGIQRGGAAQTVKVTVAAGGGPGAPPP